MDRAAHVRVDRAALIDWLADDVHDAAKCGRANRHVDRATEVSHRIAANQALGGVHGDRANRVLAEVLGNLEDQAVAVIVGLKRVENARKLAVELDVDHGADDLRYAAFCVCGSAHAGRLLWSGCRLGC